MLTACLRAYERGIVKWEKCLKLPGKTELFLEERDKKKVWRKKGGGQGVAKMSCESAEGIWANTDQTRGWTPWHVVSPRAQSKQSSWSRREVAQRVRGWTDAFVDSPHVYFCVYTYVVLTLRCSVMNKGIVCVSQWIYVFLCICFYVKMCLGMFRVRIVASEDSVCTNSKVRMSSLCQGIY